MSPFFLGLQRTLYWGLIGGHGAFFLCASLKQMWNVLNAFPRSSHSWEERQVPHPFQAVTCGRKWFPQTSNLASPPPTENRGKSDPAQAESDPGLAHTLPSQLLATACDVSWSWIYFLSTASPCRFLRAVGLFYPLLLQPGVLACLLSRNSKVGSQGLSCMLPSAFSIQLLREALTGYISRFHFLPFLLWTAARKLFLVSLCVCVCVSRNGIIAAEQTSGDMF